MLNCKACPWRELILKPKYVAPGPGQVAMATRLARYATHQTTAAQFLSLSPLKSLLAFCALERWMTASDMFDADQRCLLQISLQSDWTPLSNWFNNRLQTWWGHLSWSDRLPQRCFHQDHHPLHRSKSTEEPSRSLQLKEIYTEEWRKKKNQL